MGIKQSKRSVEISSTPKKGAVDVPVQVDILFENMQYSLLLPPLPGVISGIMFFICCNIFENFSVRGNNVYFCHFFC